MGKKNKNKSPRPGSVAANRAAGTNKAAQNQAAKAAASPSPSPAPSPRPAPSPSPSPSPSSSGGGGNSGGGGGGGGNVNRVGSVAYNRANGLNKNPNRSNAKSVSQSFTNAQMAGTAGGAKGLTKARREAQQNSGMSMKAYKAGVSSGLINKHGAKNTSGGVSNNSGGSAWDNMNANFNQSEWDATVKDNWNDYVKNNPNSGLSYGPEFKGAQWGENGLKMDANAPIMIPNLGKYGFKRGDMAFDPDGYKVHEGNKNNRTTGITGRIAYMNKEGRAIYESNDNVNPNWDKYAPSGSERMSSEGTYQDMYNVGYGGADDKGSEYATTDAMGNIGSYFKEYNEGERSFGAAYNMWAGNQRKEGYAGDVLKFIDKGGMKVNDDDYNMLVTDAKNYDWDHRNKLSGMDAGQDSYDVRAGGEAQNNITGGGSFDQAPSSATQQGNTPAAQQSNSFTAMPQMRLPKDPTSETAAHNSQTNLWNSNHMFKNKGLGMDFSFNPGKFMQGQ